MNIPLRSRIVQEYRSEPLERWWKMKTVQPEGIRTLDLMRLYRSALPAELQVGQKSDLAVETGIEPATHGLSVRCSTN